MIVLDTSAMVAIVQREPEAEAFSDMVARAGALAVSALILFETRTVIGKGRTPPRLSEFEVWFVGISAKVFPFDAAMADAAYAAYSRYGKGVHPRARLNICDCAAYALAKSLDAPLLFKGADFRHTDVTAAI
ncbi:MAG: type II toxin-antitoxin system VapC family toxin [Hyphomonadaceae bacterium]|nr:MAG: hypothetical protein FD160_3819 [Caulobacteraceae bacterium]MBT9447142.1 type II toxin-antitoxin system VapC family toxin [Hyphomonadaceae bacterium]TPW05829.1 MAG: hypothetical protein FD124_1998 [Alphaproteobacteria bacterium]